MNLSIRRALAAAAKLVDRAIVATVADAEQAQAGRYTSSP